MVGQFLEQLVTGRDFMLTEQTTRVNELKHSFEAAALPLMDVLRSKALKLTGNLNDAEDLLQDTYVLGLRKFDMYQPGTHLKAWLSRLQFNLYISQYRRRRKRPDGVSIAGMEETVRARAYTADNPELYEMNPDEMLETTDFMESLPAELRSGLSEMDERYRDVLLLNVIAERSYKDIAANLSVPLGTVMSRLSRAKAFLRQYFEETGINAVQS
jgi:RNA polymerase sigma-70 factor, ECF subfamily